MAVHNKTTTGANAGANTTTQKTHEQTQQNAYENRSNNTHQNYEGARMNQRNTFHGGNRMNSRAYSPSVAFGRSIAPDVNDGNIQALARALSTARDNHGWNENEIGSAIRFRAVSAATIGQSISSVVAAATVKTDTGAVCIIRTILCYAGAQGYGVRKEQFGNETYERQTLAADATNAEYWEQIVSLVAPSDIENVQVWNAGVTTVNSETFKDTDEAAVDRLMKATATSMMDTYQTDVLGMTYDVPAFVSEGMRLKVTPTLTNSDPYVTETGKVVRADIQVPWYITAEQYGQESAQEEIGRVCGYVELYPLPQQNNGGIFNTQKQEIDPYYEAVFVVTHCGPKNPMSLCVPELYLLSFYGAYLTTINNGWLRTYQPSIGNSNPLHALSGIGYYSPAAAALPDLDRASTTPQDVDQLMSALLLKPQGSNFPTPAFAIDIDPSDDRSGNGSMMLGVMNGDPKAISRFTAACDALTSGHFSRMWNPNEPIVDSNYNLISIGEYVDGNGNRRDARDYGTLAMLNLTLGNMNDFIDYACTLDSGNEPMHQRLQRDRLWSNMAQIKNSSYAVRMFLNANWFVVMQRALQQAKAEPRIEGMNDRNSRTFVGAPTSRIASQSATYTRPNTGYGNGNNTFRSGWGM